MDEKKYWPTYCHVGDFGDMVYALAVVKELGGGHLVLARQYEDIRLRFTPEKVEACKPILLQQPYIKSVQFSEKKEGHCLNGWRLSQERNNHRYNTVEQTALACGLQFEVYDGKWLDCIDPIHVADVVVVRTARVHCPFAEEGLWRPALARYPNAVFVGLPEEHKAFEDEVQRSIKFHDCPDPTYLFRTIAGCKLLLGNQSGAMALALGLGKAVVQEVDETIPLARHRGENRVYWGRHGFWQFSGLPEV